MKHCKTCAYWHIPETDSVSDCSCNPTDLDTDMRILPYTCGLCVCPTLIECGSPTCSNGAAVQDGSDYMAKLVCAPYFGCVNHKSAKEAL